VASAGLYAKSAPHPRQPRQHPTTQFFTGRMPFLPPNQQCQSTEGISNTVTNKGISTIPSNMSTNVRIGPPDTSKSILPSSTSTSIE